MPTDREGGGGVSADSINCLKPIMGPPRHPPAPPLPPLAPGWRLFHNAADLADAVRAASPGETLSCLLIPSHRYLLDAEMVVDGFSLTIATVAGDGATLDAQSTSRLFKVVNGGNLSLNALTLAHGHVSKVKPHPYVARHVHST